MSGQVYFVSGIDTGIGKSYATGYLAQQWRQQGCHCITQKLVQTGNEHYSEDIEQHRRLMQSDLLIEDRQGLTMPEIFPYPASPHLASALAGRAIDFAKINAATAQLAARYEVVLLEGAGGLMVPLTREMLTIDYIAQHHYPVILVTSGRLGSINHTLLSLAALQQRGIQLHALAYNLNDQAQDPVISQDTAQYLAACVARDFPTAQWIDIPVL
ncbi:dethiobiotin synthase [Acinetobacter larvae]|uniref:ATP-dependent dethiobiotin synthetase BioD n=1 Tax=Acinetobacter larvae TaxID=1789224 RepID=A0A1B2LX26_9GAMM|nr:dethiobiotin synthase [Acinetobacter larvae]AOA57439.1 dethiobiotin synthase [Acinetobacter larvae]